MFRTPGAKKSSAPRVASCSAFVQGRGRMPESRPRYHLPILLAIISLVVGGAAYFLIQSRGAAAKSPVTLAWRAHDVEGLTIDAPFPFAPTGDMLPQLPPEVRLLVSSWKNQGGALPGDTLRANISHILYQADVGVSLEGAANGAMTEAAAALGDEKPQYTVVSTQVSGLEARRASYTGRIKRQPIWIDALFVLRGQELWQIQTIVSVDTVRAAGERLLASVRMGDVGSE